MMTKHNLRVWHIPQLPMKAYYVPVSTPEEALWVMEILWKYDEFEYRNKVKPDYSNVSGLEVFEDGEWVEWHHPILDCDIDEYKYILEGADDD